MNETPLDTYPLQTEQARKMRDLLKTFLTFHNMFLAYDAETEDVLICQDDKTDPDNLVTAEVPAFAYEDLVE